MLLTFMVNIYHHPMFWWVIVPLISVTLLVSFMLWESRVPKNLTGKK